MNEELGSSSYTGPCPAQTLRRGPTPRNQDFLGFASFSAHDGSPEGGTSKDVV